MPGNDGARLMAEDGRNVASERLNDETIVPPVPPPSTAVPNLLQRNGSGARERLVEAALAYARHGWPVFPLRGKVPARAKCDGGKGFHDASTDPGVVEGMWRTYPGANIGIRTGTQSALAVLDVDPDKGGTQTLTGIETERGILPGTLMQITGGDGLHMLYQHRDGLGIGSHVWGPGLDLRGEGGYIVAAPSVHPDTGRAYAWSGDGSWWHPLPRWPGQLPIGDRPKPAPAGAVIPFRRTGQGPLAGLVQFVLDAPEGERNTRLNWAAYRAGQHVHAGRLDEREAVAALALAARHAGLTGDETRLTIASGLGSGSAA